VSLAGVVGLVVLVVHCLASLAMEVDLGFEVALGLDVDLGFDVDLGLNVYLDCPDGPDGGRSS